MMENITLYEAMEYIDNYLESKGNYLDKLYGDNVKSVTTSLNNYHNAKSKQEKDLAKKVYDANMKEFRDKFSKNTGKRGVYGGPEALMKRASYTKADYEANPNIQKAISEIKDMHRQKGMNKRDQLEIDADRYRRMVMKKNTEK